jgi:hypothetical protein
MFVIPMSDMNRSASFGDYGKAHLRAEFILGILPVQWLNEN